MATAPPARQWARIRGQGHQHIARLSELLTKASFTSNEDAAKTTAALRGLAEVWNSLHVLLDTAALEQNNQQESFANERAELKRAIKQLRHEGVLGQALAANHIEAARSDLLPAHLRPLAEECQALRSQVRNYSTRVERAEHRVQEAEAALVKLELENATLQAQVKACHPAPEQVEQWRAQSKVCKSQEATIQELEHKLDLLTERSLSEQKKLKHQVTRLQHDLASMQNSQEFVLTNYTYPVTAGRCSLSPKSRGTSIAAASSVPGMESSYHTVSITPECSDQGLRSPTTTSWHHPPRTAPHVVRALLGSTAAATHTLTIEASVLPALSQEPSSLSNVSSRQPHRRAAQQRPCGALPASTRQQPMQVTHPGAPFSRRPLHMSSYIQAGGSDPVLVAASSGSGLITTMHRRVMPKPHSPKSPYLRSHNDACSPEPVDPVATPARHMGAGVPDCAGDAVGQEAQVAAAVTAAEVDGSAVEDCATGSPGAPAASHSEDSACLAPAMVDTQTGQAPGHEPLEDSSPSVPLAGDVDDGDGAGA